ncbi:sensor histidine kinase [Aestuariibaculum sediminum]|uniref:Histidine kinase n=1 Tax=Aestuariibaculum sediminum TaxID=2770637 RepID=A0A8J6UH09_9FLAO|nr:histidine kinase [Aestuariibaculum sediminum]MBD0832396.1 histidine kinase [Aestuariibaculum sediminum]
MKKLILLLAILIAVPVFILKDSKSRNDPYRFRKSNTTLDTNWEFIKERLYSGKGEGEFVYKVDYLNKHYPILFDIESATAEDSLIVRGVIEELRSVIPNRTIDIFSNYIGKSLDDFRVERFKSKNRNKEFLGKNIPFNKLNLITVRLRFGGNNDDKINYRERITTVFDDGSSIERTNPLRMEHYIYFPNMVWFNLKDELPKEKREKYIKYEMLRTLCYVYPHDDAEYKENDITGVFYRQSYIPETAVFTEEDKFLLNKLYEDDFIKQFKDYLKSRYTWRYANNFINKDFTAKKVWAAIIVFSVFIFLMYVSFYKKDKFKYQYLDYLIPITVVLLCYVDVVVILHTLTQIRNDLPSLEKFAYVWLFTILFALFSALVFRIIEKFMIDKMEFFTMKLIFKVILTLVVFNIPIGIVLIIKGLDGDVSDGFVEFYLPTFILTIILALGRGLLIYLNHFSENLVKQKDLELTKLRELNANAQVKLLHSQINPHFLYNALNSIAGLATVDGEKTEHMALALSDLFKYTINRKGEKFSTIKDELEMVNNYLEVEQIRFGDRLQFKIECDERLKGFQIPRFLIQPLIENAVKHGASKVQKKACIGLSIKKENHQIIIKVTDNGPEFPEGLVSGHGLQSVYDLLELSYGNKAQLSWNNTPEKHISITIKQKDLNDE